MHSELKNLGFPAHRHNVVGNRDYGLSYLSGW